MHLYPIDGAVQRVGKDDDRLEHARRDVVDGHRRASMPTRNRQASSRAGAEGYWEAVHPFNLGGAAM